MSKEKDEGKKIPEWSIFERLDELEDIALNLMDKTDKADPALHELTISSEDAEIMAKYGIWAMFIMNCKLGADPRAGKTLVIKQLKEWGLSEKSLNWVQEALSGISDFVDNETKKKGHKM